MARQPKVSVDGNELKNILEVSFGVHAALDRDGAPTRGLISDGILIRRVADAADDLADWASSADDANRKSGEVEFVDANGLAMKTLKWKGGYIRHYDVDYDDAGEHVEETIVVEAETIEVNGEEHFFDWKNK